MKLVIDTNVAVAANGRGTHANVKCQLRCIDLLERIANGTHGGIVVLDELGEVLSEYRRHLNFQGQPGVGDLYYKFLHDHLYSEGKVQRVAITPSTDGARGFEELPRNALDPSDRKLLAVALISGAKLVNALDNDWHEQRLFLDELGVKIDQLCPEHGCLISG